MTGIRVGRPGASPTSAPILDIADWHVPSGRVIGVTGPSGSGKSTLVHILAGLLVPDAGTVAWGDIALPSSERERDGWRRRTAGLVFQDMHLLPGLTAIENVLLPWRFDHVRLPGDAARDGQRLLERMGLGAVAGRPAGVLSRGEQQRVALARAVARSPRVILADEPTASLDAAGGEALTDLLLEVAAERGATTLIVSHDPQLLARLPRVDRLVAGRFVPTLQARAS